MTSCGRGRDSATLECFGRGYRGTIFVRSSKLSLFLPEFCPFEEFFCFPRFWKIWRQMFKLWGFWFRRCFGALFENSARHRAFFCELLLRPQVFLENFLSFFQSGAGFTSLTAMAIPSLSKALWWWYVKNQNENSTSGRWRDRAQKDHRSSSRLVQVVCDDPWSRRGNKTQRSQRVIVRRLNPSSSTNQLVLRSLFPRPDVATVSHFAVFVDVDVTAARSGCSAGTAKKSSHPWHFRCCSLRRNELECTDLVHWTEALHRFSSRDAIIVVGSVLEKHFDGDFTPDQEKKITFKRWPPGYQSWKFGLALNGLK